MFAFLENNYILAAVSSLVIILIFYIDGRKKKERTFTTYFRYYLLTFLLILGILLYKTKNFTLPSINKNMQGGSMSSSVEVASRHPQVNIQHNMDLLNIGDPEF